MISKGDQVRVYPHGSPERQALALVVLISENQRSIAVAFGDPPPFVTARGGLMIHPAHGVVMLAGRATLEVGGEAWGPWVELSGGGHYEIEEANGEGL
jgi:hypothetical protein